MRQVTLQVTACLRRCGVQARLQSGATPLRALLLTFAGLRCSCPCLVTPPMRRAMGSLAVSCNGLIFTEAGLQLHAHAWLSLRENQHTQPALFVRLRSGSFLRGEEELET